MRWLGIESDERYIQPSRERIAAREPLAKNDPLFMEFSRKKPPRVPFVQLIEAGYLQVGQVLHLHNANHRAKILANGKLCANEIIGTIHGLARELKNLRAANGWHEWCYEEVDGSLHPIDTLRQRYRDAYL